MKGVTQGAFPKPKVPVTPDPQEELFWGPPTTEEAGGTFDEGQVVVACHYIGVREEAPQEEPVAKRAPCI